MRKKNSHGGLLAFFLSCFAFCFIGYSSCFATTPSNQLTDYGTQQLIDYFYDLRSNYVQDTWNKMNNFNSFYSNLQVSSVTQTLNDTFTTWSTTFPNLEQITFSLAVDNNSNYRLIAIQNNNGIGNTLPFIKLNGQVYSSSSNYSPTFINDSENSASGTTLLFNFNTNGTLSYAGYQNTIPNLSYKLSPLFDKTVGRDTADIWNFINFGIATFYLKSNNNDTFQWVWNTNRLYNSEPIPEPTPTPTPSAVGTITSPSGDNLGNINLQPIQQGITDVKNQISGDAIRIVNAISGESTKIVNAITDTTIDTDVSGELANMIQTDINNPSVNFFSWLLDEFESIFSTTSEQTIEFDIMTKHIVISTNDFIFPESDFKNFMQLAFTAFFGYSIIKKVYYIVYAVKCVRLTDAMHQVEFNPNVL